MMTEHQLIGCDHNERYTNYRIDKTFMLSTVAKIKVVLIGSEMYAANRNPHSNQHPLRHSQNSFNVYLSIYLLRVLSDGSENNNRKSSKRRNTRSNTCAYPHTMCVVYAFKYY